MKHLAAGVVSGIRSVIRLLKKPQLIDNIDKFVYMANCDHEWTIMTSNSTTGRIYRCNKCGATKTEPLINYFTMI